MADFKKRYGPAQAAENFFQKALPGAGGQDILAALEESGRKVKTFGLEPLQELGIKLQLVPLPRRDTDQSLTAAGVFQQPDQGVLRLRPAVRRRNGNGAGPADIHRPQVLALPIFLIQGEDGQYLSQV